MALAILIVAAPYDGRAEEGRPAPPPAPVATRYPHGSVGRHEYGAGARSYWLFEPADPTPERAPVVVFLHGWLALNPGVYGAWIEHLVRRGQVVIFPRYQAGWATRPAEFLPGALAAVRDALDVLREAPGHVRPDLRRFALIGHSAGGDLAARLAAVARAEGLPPPRALLLLMPGRLAPCRGPSLAAIPTETLLVIAVADRDHLVGDRWARRIFAKATAVPRDRKLFVLYRTDRHGHPPLKADHLAPTSASPSFDTGDGPFRSAQMARATVDALDRRGFWRLADLTLEAGFAGRSLAEATERGARLRELGHWGDGVPVLAPILAQDPATIPRAVRIADADARGRASPREGRRADGDETRVPPPPRRVGGRDTEDRPIAKEGDTHGYPARSRTLATLGSGAQDPDLEARPAARDSTAGPGRRVHPHPARDRRDDAGDGRDPRR